MTAGLTASATVMALNISLASAASAEEDTPPGSLYGDATILDPDADGGPPADAP